MRRYICVERYIGKTLPAVLKIKKTTTAMATRGWRNKIFHELNDGLARVFNNFVSWPSLEKQESEIA